MVNDFSRALHSQFVVVVDGDRHQRRPYQMNCMHVTIVKSDEDEKNQHQQRERWHEKSSKK